MSLINRPPGPLTSSKDLGIREEADLPQDEYKHSQQYDEEYDHLHYVLLPHPIVQHNLIRVTADECIKVLGPRLLASCAVAILLIEYMPLLCAWVLEPPGDQHTLEQWSITLKLTMYGILLIYFTTAIYMVGHYYFA